MNNLEPETSAVEEDQFHQYRGNQIPWYVRLIWIGFWIFAIAYTLRYLFPSLTQEIFPEP